MKVSLNWLEDYLDLDLSAREIADKLTELGLETNFTSRAKSFEGVVLGRVLECDPHPDADKLSVCQVDVGDDENYGIVCGAPNVKSGIHVPVATVGSTLQNGEFKVKKAKLRGVLSNGMICSGRELSYNDDHEGILILDTKEKLGTPIENILSFSEDVTFELDLTPNRGDCLSHLGVARELGIVTRQDVIRRKYDILENDEQIANAVSVNIDVPDACPRYAARVIKGVKVGPSPQWILERLQSIGLGSINNVVDAANYVLMDSGHPMHTFDLEEINENTINVRFAKKGEKFRTLDEIERKLDDFHLLICDDKKPVALGGIMGGVNSEITESTTDILLESAYFNPTVVRKGAKALDLSTEASRRFERDTDIDGVIPAIDQLAQLICELSGGTVLKGVVDQYPQKHEPNIVHFSMEKCNLLLGIDLDENEYNRIFTSLQITVEKKKGSFICNIPSFRNDLLREVDLCEEVARIVGYDNIPSATQFSGTFTSFTEDDQTLDFSLRTTLQASGFHEHYSNSLTGENYTGHFDGGVAVKIKNALSQDMAFIRNSILPGLIMAASYNEKRQEKGFKLFEIGAIHNYSKKSKTQTKEKFHLGLLWYGKPGMHWRQYEDRDIFRCKGEISQILNTMGLMKIRFKTGRAQGFEKALKIYSEKTQLGILGIPSLDLLNEYDLNQAPVICDISMTSLRDIWQSRNLSCKLPPQYPSVNRDIALQVSCNVPSEDLFHTIWNEGGDILSDVTLFDVYQAEDVGDENKSLAFSLTFQSHASTLKYSEVDVVVNRILKSLDKIYRAIQR